MRGVQPRLYAAISIAALSVAPCSAESQSRAEAAWRELALADLEAAYGIVSRNHPGAARATGDTAFQRALADGLTAGRDRAGRVTTYEGWLATLRAFAVGLGDPHISLQPRLTLGTLRWPGFVIGRRGEATVVVARDTAGGDELPPPGTRVLSCDGIPVDEYGRSRLGTFRGTWEISSQRVRTTPLLLVDDGNPFLPRPRACLVHQAGVERAVELGWRNISATALQDRIREAAPIGRAGYVVRRAGAGWWIGIESLGGPVQRVLDSVGAHATEIRRAPWVIVDVRGNGGGNSEWGRRLADVLVGPARTSAAMRRAEREVDTGPWCGSAWRVSDDVEETLTGYIAELGPRLGQAAVDRLTAERDSVRAALAAGRELAPEPRRCPPAASEGAGELPPSETTGRLVLLTDHACFSSCLLMAALFRAVGALHVGEGTDFSTRYMEVRAFPLPSGLGRFATVQKVSFSAPPRLGPYEPEVPYPGSIADTDAVEKWIVQLMQR
jgi:hypothetical protein